MASITVEEALSRASDSISTAASLLWDLDVNRLRPGTDYKLDVQDRSRGYTDDAASQPFVSYLSDDVWTRPTFATFKKLLDNYIAETGVPEIVSEEERIEEDRFLAAICETPCIRFIHKWLATHANVNAGSISDFSEYLKRIWFHLYRRDASADSSGFSHVFCGELDDGKVKGLHNFVQVYIEEARGNFNYKGYLDVRGEPAGPPPPPNQQLLTIRFDWLNMTKSVSSMFVGPSPEFEIALYTLLYVAGQEDLELDLGPYQARIKVYQMAGKIGTAFPELLAVDSDRLQAEANAPAETYDAEPMAPPTADDFPALGAVSPPPAAASSYAAAAQSGGGDAATGGEAQQEEGGQEEGQAKNILKWLKIFISVGKKMKLIK